MVIVLFYWVLKYNDIVVVYLVGVDFFMKILCLVDKVIVKLVYNYYG